MAQTVRRLMVIAIAVVVIVGAVAWVSVTFTDRSFACGTALGEARHGEVMPAVIFGSTPPSPWTLAARRIRVRVKGGGPRLLSADCTSGAPINPVMPMVSARE